MLYRKPWVWAASGKSLPSYRLSLALPLVQELGFYVTDRRVLLLCALFRLVSYEFSAWFDGKAGHGDPERLKAVSAGRHRLFGPYLQLLTQNPTRHWWRCHEARIRLFMSRPEDVCSTITEAMRQMEANGDKSD